MSVDAVLSIHTNPMTCGVSKFNHALAKRLDVPCRYLGYIHEYQHPMVSLKLDEGGIGSYFPGSGVDFRHPYDLLLHDWRQYPHYPDLQWLIHAQHVYAANGVIAGKLSHFRPDIITAFCPSTVEGNPDRGGYRVLTFGMSHKLVLPHFEKLKRELDRDHPDYTISLSTAVHEGNPWDKALTQSVEAMRGIFGDRLRVLGFLADDALARELQECDAVAAFFIPALRANNTSAWAALSAGKFLYTNLDSQSPALDPQQYSWEALLKVLA